MKKLLVGTLIIGTSMFASMSKSELDTFKSLNVLSDPAVTLIDGKKIDGSDLTLLKGYFHSGDSYSPINLITNKEIVITGQAFNAKSKLPYLIDTDYSQFEKYAAFKIGTGSKRLMLFTDAECPYCKQFDSKFDELKNEYTIYVYMLPLNEIHFASKDIAIATFAQDKDKEQYFKKLMHSQDLTKDLPELAKYSVELYKNIKNSINSLNPKVQGLGNKYVQMVQVAYNVKFENREDISKFCDKKIEEFYKNKAAVELNKKALAMFEENAKLSGGYLGANGTPMVYDYSGVNVELQNLFKMN